MRCSTFLMVATFSLLSACASGIRYADTEGDSDTDSDSDADSDADADSDTDTDSDSDADTTIYDLHAGEVADEDVVTLEGVVVTATTKYGVWVQEPDGGTFSGVWVYLSASWTEDWPELAADKNVDITGTFLEFADEDSTETLTEIDAAAGTVVVNGDEDAPDAETVSALDLSSASAEDWEGVLVHVEGPLTVEAVDGGEFGEWTITDGADSFLVDDACYDALGDLGLVVDSKVDHITGIWH